MRFVRGSGLPGRPRRRNGLIGRCWRISRWQGTRAGRPVVAPRAGPAAIRVAAVAVQAGLALALLAGPAALAGPGVPAGRPGRAGRPRRAGLADRAPVVRATGGGATTVAAARLARADVAHADDQRTAFPLGAAGGVAPAAGPGRVATGRGRAVMVRPAVGRLPVRMPRTAVPGREAPAMARAAAGLLVRAGPDRGRAAPVTAQAAAGPAMAPEQARRAPGVPRGRVAQAKADGRAVRGPANLVAVVLLTAARAGIPADPTAAPRRGVAARARRPRQVGQDGTARNTAGHLGQIAVDRLGLVARDRRANGGKAIPADGATTTAGRIVHGRTTAARPPLGRAVPAVGQPAARAAAAERAGRPVHALEPQAAARIGAALSEIREPATVAVQRQGAALATTAAARQAAVRTAVTADRQAAARMAVIALRPAAGRTRAAGARLAGIAANQAAHGADRPVATTAARRLVLAAATGTRPGVATVTTATARRVETGGQPTAGPDSTSHSWTCRRASPRIS